MQEFVPSTSLEKIVPCSGTLICMAYYWCFYYITFAPVGCMTTMLGIARETKGASSTDSVCNHTVASWAHSSLCHTHKRKRFSTRPVFAHAQPASLNSLTDGVMVATRARSHTVFTRPVLAPKRCSLMHDCGHDARHTKGPTCGAVRYALPVITLRKYCDPVARRSTYTKYTTETCEVKPPRRQEFRHAAESNHQ